MIPRILDMLFLSAPHLAGDDVRQRSEERRRYRFYPRHPRGWRQREAMRGLDGLYVSIHATLAGGDIWASTRLPPTQVSIHATLAGGDSSPCASPLNCARFYPRHPRGWRRDKRCIAGVPRSFYPRHPRGWRRQPGLLAGLPHKFLSTPPSRVATFLSAGLCSRRGCFYPRHPRGWRRPALPRRRREPGRFYPRHPRGWRRYTSGSIALTGRFYPRHPRGWRQIQGRRLRQWALVSIHATLAGGDHNAHIVVALLCVSIHATLAGGDELGDVASAVGEVFLSTPPSRVDRKSTRLNSSHEWISRMPSSA